MTELMTALMVWLGAHTGLPVPADLPTVRLAAHCEIQELVYAAGKCLDDLGAVALYMHERDTIYMPDTWSAASLYDVSMLLHELAHFMQDRAGLTSDSVGCVAAELERPAYEAQIAWLEAAGVDAFETMNINGLNYLYLVNCVDPVTGNITGGVQ